jgi:hypothetical protein
LVAVCRIVFQLAIVASAHGWLIIELVEASSVTNTEGYVNISAFQFPPRLLCLAASAMCWSHRHSPESREQREPDGFTDDPSDDSIV